jgi:hypothetical protein
MGNIFNSDPCFLCKRRSDFNKCQDLNEVEKALDEEIKNVQEKSKLFRGESGTINSRINIDVQRISYYLKLELLLMKIKSLIVQNVIMEDYDNGITQRNLIKKRSFKSKQSLLTSDIRLLKVDEVTGEIIKPEEDFADYEPKKYKRRNQKSLTTREHSSGKKEIDFSVCITVINDILATEDTLNEARLKQIEINIESRIYNVINKRTILATNYN